MPIITFLASTYVEQPKDWNLFIPLGIIAAIVLFFYATSLRDANRKEQQKAAENAEKKYNQEHAYEIAKERFSKDSWYDESFCNKAYFDLSNNLIDRFKYNDLKRDLKYLNKAYTEEEEQELVIYLLRGDNDYIMKYLGEYERKYDIKLTDEEKKELRKFISVKKEERYKKLINKIERNKRTEMCKPLFNQSETEEMEETAIPETEYGTYVRNPRKIICLDVETTDKSPENAEILQLSIIDYDGNVLFNKYIKPDIAEEWPGAERINHISPKKVSQKHHLDHYYSELDNIFKEADLIVAYNGDHYDIPIIAKYGFEYLLDKPSYDVMLKFAPIYGAWDEYHQSYTWQKLKTCADHYGYRSNGEFHDSLEDIRATLFCYKKMTGKDENEAILKSHLEESEPFPDPDPYDYF